MIGFLHPWVLAALVAAGIPVLLHLVHRREPPTVVFPAVRYLVAATRRHERRFKLHNWLLLLLRTLLVIVLVLAAAGPTVPARGVAGRAPGALVLVVDNSVSSGAVVDGTPRLRVLREAAGRVLARATADDALWLIAADGLPRRGDAASLRRVLDGLEPSPRRLDLGEALRAAADVLAGEQRSGEIVLFTDLQATAVSAAEVGVPVTVVRPTEPPPPNHGIGALDVGAQPWAIDGGRVTVRVVGDTGAPVPVTIGLGAQPRRQALAAAGGGATVTIPGVTGGWWPIVAELDPDELRADDRRVGVVRVAPVARVTWAPEARYVAAAAQVLEANRRIVRGDEITLGTLADGPSIVEPPADPAELGALNRALERRGAAWRFGRLVEAVEAAEGAPGLDGVRVVRRYTLEPVGSGRTGVVARVGGAPWIVRSGGIVLLGSRLDPAWTALPVSAGFMPFMDFLLNRAARGEVAVVPGAPGDALPLPDRVTEVTRDDRVWPVEGGGPFTPPDPGIYFLRSGRDTVGALAVNPDPRESVLARASDEQVQRLWGARIVAPADADRAAFVAAPHGDLRGPLLWAGLLLGLMEVGLASWWRRTA